MAAIIAVLWGLVGCAAPVERGTASEGSELFAVVEWSPPQAITGSDPNAKRISDLYADRKDVVEFLGRRTQADVSEATPKFFPLPLLPRKFMKSRKSILVSIVFLLDQKGEVEDARILGTAVPDVDRLVIESIRSWRFTPATMYGRSVKRVMLLKFHFKKTERNNLVQRMPLRGIAD